MNSPQSLAPLRQSDYEAIEAAVMETEKGRWFLAEYARRHRAADTTEVLGAIGRLERMLKRERRPDVDRIRLDIGEMKDAIERTKLEIAQIKHDAANKISKFDSASNELDAIVTQTEAATSEILGAAEKIQEIVWTMREDGIAGPICDSLEELVMTMYTSCSFQDLTGQRTQKVVHVLRYLESRIDAMIEIWGMEDGEVATTARSAPDRGPVLDTRPDAHLLNGPQLEGHGIGQGDIDTLLDDLPTVDAAQFDNDLSFDAIDVSDDAAPAAVFDNGLSFDDLDVSDDAAPAAVFDNDVSFDDLDVSDNAAPAAVFDNDLSFDALDIGDDVPVPANTAADDAEAAAFLDDAYPATESLDEEEADGVGPEIVALGDQAEAESTGPAAVHADDAALARAAEAMDTAIETLKEVSAAVTRSTPATATGDPFQFLSKAERQALLA